MPPKKPSRELLKEWYAKLEAAGFHDIEQDEIHLKFWDTGRLNKKETYLITATQDYYRFAEHFLNDHKFDKELDKVIWEYHANGLSAREIAKVLNKVLPKKTNRTSVWIVIRDLRKKMKLLYGVKNHDGAVN